jgi:hypothetical protein
MRRRAFNEEIYRNRFSEGWVSDAARSSLSRAYRRLEQRGFLIRADGCWRLTENGRWVAEREALEWMMEKKRIDQQSSG